MTQSWIFTDCEAYGGCPRTGQLTEFGAVDFKTRQTFHGVIMLSKPDPKNPAIPLLLGPISLLHEEAAFLDFERWLRTLPPPWVFWSDNPAFDWQWINDGFWRHLGRNPFGHSARRIGDLYAGLVKDPHATSKWKRFRVTPHDHNPVHDALGNVEAVATFLKEHGIKVK
jgi:hypothetical protein